MDVPACPHLKSIAFALLLAASPMLQAAALRSESARVSQGAASASAPALRVALTGDYQPFSYRISPDGPFVGLDVVLAQDLARQLGRPLEIVPTSWPTLMADLVAGRFDLAMGGISVTPERAKRAGFSVPLLHDGKTAIARCAELSHYQSLEQINRPEVRVVENPGGTNERFARARAPRAALRLWPDNVSIFGQILAGEADLMFTDAIEARLQQRLHPGQLCAVHPDAPFDHQDKAVLLAPGDAALKAAVDRWVLRMQADGSFARRFEQWLDYPWGVFTLTRLMDERLQLAREVARAKWNSHGAIEDLPREAQIVDRLSAQAVAAGVPAALAQRFFLAQIEASKTVQRDLFAQWEAAQAAPFAEAPDLVRDLRPRLDALTPPLLQALAEHGRVQQDAARAAQAADAVAQWAASASLSRQAARQAAAPLMQLAPSGPAPR